MVKEEMDRSQRERCNAVVDGSAMMRRYERPLYPWELHHPLSRALDDGCVYALLCFSVSLDDDSSFDVHGNIFNLKVPCIGNGIIDIGSINGNIWGTSLDYKLMFRQGKSGGTFQKFSSVLRLSSAWKNNDLLRKK